MLSSFWGVPQVGPACHGVGSPPRVAKDGIQALVRRTGLYVMRSCCVFMEKLLLLCWSLGWLLYVIGQGGGVPGPMGGARTLSQNGSVTQRSSQNRVVGPQVPAKS